MSEANFDPAGDMLLADGLQSVVLRQPASTSAINIAHALRRAADTQQSEAADGRLLRHDTVWHLPQAEAQSAPAPGATLTDGAGIRWTVLETALETLGARWRCVCRALAIAARLDGLLVIQQATYDPAPAGDRAARWHDLVSGVRCAIEPESAGAHLENNARDWRRRFRITIAEPVTLSGECRAIDAEGAVYAIVGYERAARIDALPALLAERTPWPEAAP